ncbi:MAG: phage tail protein [Tepidanaerobacter acetatoxydans]|uniref:tail protein X n=1 Tax=Tepidanaerobacter acetatoxydans TaxID=499229 RepID=UPI0026EA13B0|nr:tail protein X [Tepidanaerobacter acetatoxydans]NLU09446.1 phage tail protein [Tepidanaerobacter acetatoxydans]
MDQNRVEKAYIEVEEQDIYTTTQGDTWDIIALKVYGDEKYMSQLLKANPRYTDIIVFSAGVEIVCPDIEEDTMEHLPPWKR